MDKNDEALMRYAAKTGHDIGEVVADWMQHRNSTYKSDRATSIPMGKKTQKNKTRRKMAQKSKARNRK